MCIRVRKIIFAANFINISPQKLSDPPSLPSHPLPRSVPFSGRFYLIKHKEGTRSPRAFSSRYFSTVHSRRRKFNIARLCFCCAKHVRPHQNAAPPRRINFAVNVPINFGFLRICLPSVRSITDPPSALSYPSLQSVVSSRAKKFISAKTVFVALNFE